MNDNIFWNEKFLVDYLTENISVKRLDSFALTAICLVLFIRLFVCLFVFFKTFFIVNYGFKMFVFVLQVQSKIYKRYQTQIRFKLENLFPGLSLVSMHLTSGLKSKVSIRTNGANYTWFHF